MNDEDDGDIWARLDRCLLDPSFGQSDWLANFQAFMEIEIKPEIERLRAACGLGGLTPEDIGLVRFDRATDPYQWPTELWMRP